LLQDRRGQVVDRDAEPLLVRLLGRAALALRLLARLADVLGAIGQLGGHGHLLAVAQDGELHGGARILRGDQADHFIAAADGPPELPKLMAASVWMKLSSEKSRDRPGRTRPLALTTPTVTVCSYCRGLPTAITQSPTRMASESPSLRYGSFLSILMRMSARSVLGSVPITSAM